MKALKLNIHFHMLCLDGVYRQDGASLQFAPAPGPEELEGLVQTSAERIGRSLERSGLIPRDIENAYLAFDPRERLVDARSSFQLAAWMPMKNSRVTAVQFWPSHAR